MDRDLILRLPSRRAASLRQRLGGLLIVALTVAACGGATASASPSSGGSPSPSAISPFSSQPAATPTPHPSPRPTASGTVYVVKQGDTLYVIAVRHKVTVARILAANPTITDPNVLTIGQRIVIPAP